MHQTSEETGFRSRAKLYEFSSQCCGSIAFLRHDREGVRRLEGSDWDIAVRDLHAIRGKLKDYSGHSLVEARRHYVEQYFFSWGQVDLLPNFQWNGFTFLSSERFWKNVRVCEDGLPRPRIAHDAFLAWMTGALGGGIFKNRYKGFLLLALEKDGTELKKCLVEAFGEKIAVSLFKLLEEGRPEVVCSMVNALRSSLKRQCFKRDFSQTATDVGNHWRRELILHLRPPFPWIAFLGPDGAGKTTVIEEFQVRMSGSRLKFRRIHWRPQPKPPSGPVVTDPHAKEKRGKFLSFAQLSLLFFRWWTQWLAWVIHARAKQTTLLSDRHYLDLLVDPKRYRYGGGLKLAKTFFRFFPKPNIIVFLVGEPRTIFKRKQEVAFEELEQQVVDYRNVAKEISTPAVVIEVGKAIQEIGDEVTNEIWDKLE